MAELRRKRPPGNVVNCKIMLRFQKFPVVPPLVAVACAHRLENLQNNRIAVSMVGLRKTDRP